MGESREIMPPPSLSEQSFPSDGLESDAFLGLEREGVGMEREADELR